MGGPEGGKTRWGRPTFPPAMKNPWSRWEALLSKREGAEPLAACRIMAGIGVIASVALVIPSGVINVLWTDGGYRELGAGP